MEIFSGDFSSMEQDIKYLLEAIPRYNDKNQAYNLYRSLCSSLCFYEMLTGDAKKYIRKLDKNKHFCDLQVKKANQLYNNSIEAYIRSKDMNLSFSNALFSDDMEVDIRYEYPITDELSFDDKEIYEIVSDYLKKYNEPLLEMFNEMIKNNRLYWAIGADDNDVCGYTICNSYMKNNFILLLDSNNFKVLFTLVHELGHVFDNYNVYNMQRNMGSRYTTTSPFIETLAKLEEKRFIEFLIEEGIDKKRSMNMLTNMYQGMYDELTKIAVLSSLPDRLLRHDKYASMQKEEFYNNIPNLLFDINDSSLPDPNEYSIIDNPRYGYGTAIAIYLDALRKADKYRYQEKLSKFMSLRQGYLSPDFFKKFGVSTQEMGDIVIDEIKATDKNVLIKK